MRSIHLLFECHIYFPSLVLFEVAMMTIPAPPRSTWRYIPMEMNKMCQATPSKDVILCQNEPCKLFSRCLVSPVLIRAAFHAPFAEATHKMALGPRQTAFVCLGLGCLCFLATLPCIIFSSTGWFKLGSIRAGWLEACNFTAVGVHCCDFDSPGMRLAGTMCFVACLASFLMCLFGAAVCLWHLSGRLGSRFCCVPWHMALAFALLFAGLSLFSGAIPFLYFALNAGFSVDAVSVLCFLDGVLQLAFCILVSCISKPPAQYEGLQQ